MRTWGVAQVNDPCRLRAELTRRADFHLPDVLGPTRPPFDLRQVPPRFVQRQVHLKLTAKQYDHDAGFLCRLTPELTRRRELACHQKQPESAVGLSDSFK